MAETPMTPGSSPDVREILRSVRNNTVRSRISWDLWWAQEGAEERHKHLHAMNRYPEFFRFDAHAHLTAAVTGAYRLYDKGPNVRSLKALIDAARSTPGAPTAVNEADELLLGTDALAKQLGTLRHKAFAHTDLKKTYDEVFHAAQITPFELRLLLESALKIVNMLERALGEQTTDFYDHPVDDFRRLLRFLRDNPAGE